MVLHGIPYAPPYDISAIGDPVALRAALDDSAPVQIYRQYVAAYGLGYQVRQDAKLQLPGYNGSLDLAGPSEPDAGGRSPSPGRDDG